MKSKDDFILTNARIAIIGMGLMGGSLALGLKGKCAYIYGIDPDEITRNIARNQNIVDQVSDDPAEFLPSADLVVLAAPVPAILDILEKLPNLTPKPCMVVDLGSTKVEIVKKMALLPERFDPIGGHPICGKERLSLANADRTLYYSAPFMLTPLERSTPRVMAAINQIIVAIGAKPEIISAQDHDRIFSITSHLPFLLSSALALSTPTDVSPYIGPGFRSVSRLAGTPASMMLGVILTNRENLMNALERLQDELALLTSAIAENDAEVLQASLLAAQRAYYEILKDR